MKKALLILLGALSSAAWSQEVGAAGRLLQNEYQQQRQARSVIGRGGISVNIDWDYDYNRGYAEVFIRIPERGRYTVSIGDQEITNANGMYRFFDLAAVSQPLSIWQGRNLIYRVTINPRDNTRMVMDFFSRQGLYLLDEINLSNNQPSYHGSQWNDVWNRAYGQAPAYPHGGYQPMPPMPASEFDKFAKMYKKQSFDDDKLSFFRAQKNMLMLSTEQVAQLVKPLAFGDNKLALAKEAYSRVVDPQNYYLLLDSFTFLSEKEEFKNFLATVQSN